jgi:hypothetical protein
LGIIISFGHVNKNFLVVSAHNESREMQLPVSVTVRLPRGTINYCPNYLKAQVSVHAVALTTASLMTLEDGIKPFNRLNKT